MSHKLTIFCLIAGFCSLITAAGSTQTELSDDEILAVIDDPDALLNLLQTAPDEAPAAPISDVSSLLFTSSVRAGLGHSDNFLKKREMLVSGDYLQLEFDALASWQLARIKMTAMAFAEATVYDVDIEPSEETMVFLRYEAIRNKNNFDFGLNASILHGAFIYDSSLTDVSVPTGTEVRQSIPRFAVFVDWYASGRDKFRLGIDLERPEFNIENLDYWEPSIGLELDHLWSRGLTSTSGLFISSKRYDDRPPRTAGGIILQSETQLEVSRLLL